MRAFDVAIVGAGIVGSACAAALAREGLSVIIIDKDAPAMGTTAAGMGHIVVMDDSEAQFALTNYSRKLWIELSDELPATCEFENCGTIWVAVDDDEMAEVQRKHEFYSSRGVRSEILDPISLSKAEPNLAKDLAGGLLVPDDSVVYQLTATKYMIELAVERGAQIKTGHGVIEITNDGVKLENTEFIAAGKVVNAAGESAGRLSPQLSIKARKGHLVISERAPNFVRHQLVELGYLKSAHSSDTDSVAFNVQPRATGQVLVGSSRQFDAHGTDVDFDILRRMTSRAFRYMPALGNLAATRVWTGFRPATPDNLPYIGKIPDAKNIYAACGHEGLGITTSLGTARILTDEFLEREPSIASTPYSPERLL